MSKAWITGTTSYATNGFPGDILGLYSLILTKPLWLTDINPREYPYCLIRSSGKWPQSQGMWSLGVKTLNSVGRKYLMIRPLLQGQGWGHMSHRATVCFQGDMSCMYVVVSTKHWWIYRHYKELCCFFSSVSKIQGHRFTDIIGFHLVS